MKSSSSRDRTPRGATQPAASRRGWRQEIAEAARQAAVAARSRENELTRPRSLVVQPSTSRASQPATPADTDGVRSLGDSQTCGAPSQSSEPNSANREWFLLEPLTGNEKDDDPETMAIFLQQFGLHDDTTDASEPAAPAPKRRPGSSASSIQPSTSGASQPATLAPP